MRRPRLTAKRIEGLRIIGEIVDQQLLATLLSRAEIRKVKTARAWIGELAGWQEGRSPSNQEASHV